MVPQWKELWYRGSDVLEPVWRDPAMLARHKRYAERVLTPDFMPGGRSCAVAMKSRSAIPATSNHELCHEWPRSATRLTRSCCTASA